MRRRTLPSLGWAAAPGGDNLNLGRRRTLKQLSAQRPIPGPNVQTLTRERKARMHQAREAIIDRLAPNIHSEIDLDKFLHAVVA